MSATLIGAFESYQKSRVQFVQSIAEAANRSQNVEIMAQAGVVQLLRPLLLDNIPSIQQTAALALGRLAGYNEELAQSIVRNDILPHLVKSMSEQNRHYKKSAAFVLRSVAKHSAELAQSVVDTNSLAPLVACLEEFDPTVKEAAAWALGHVATHSAQLAQAVVDAGALPLLVLCVQEPELSLRRVAASALTDIAKHSPELAQSVVDSAGVTHLAPLCVHPDSKLKRQACSGLAQIAKHHVDLAEVVVEADIFPRVLLCLRDVDESVRKAAATLVREVVKHTPELAKLVVNAGGAAALVDFVRDSTGSVRLPGIMALGYIAAFSETIALAVIIARGAGVLKEALLSEPEDHIKAATVWSLGQIGRHTPEHAKAVAEGGVFPVLLVLMSRDDSSEDLRLKCKRALKAVVGKCLEGPALAPLLRDVSPKAQKYALAQFAALLPLDALARKAFMQSGLLQRTQELKAAAPPPKVLDAIARINACFPDEAVKFSDPLYARELLARLDTE